MTLDLYAASSRPMTRRPDRETAHSFSFGEHYDHTNLGFGPLIAHNDDHVSPGGGYPAHPHSDLEIVTWVLSGALVHADSLGHRSVLETGTVQVQSAGSGITHSEIADAESGPTRFVQAWVRPDSSGGIPRRTTSTPVVAPGLQLVAGGSELPLGVAGASFWIGDGSSSVTLPEAPLLHIFDAVSGDAWRISDEPGRELSLDAPGLLLVWAFGSAAG